MKELWRKIKKYKNIGVAIVLEIIYPRICNNCEKEGKYICDDCYLFVSEAGFVCPSCGKSSYFGERHWRCYDAKSLSGLVSIWDYDGIIREIIFRIKYKGTFHILEELTERVIFLFKNDITRFSLFLKFLNNDETFITFVPIHRKKKIKRGFDQAEILAKHIAKVVGKEYVSLLKRTKNTKSQTEFQKRKERKDNIKNAFSFVNPLKINISRVVIVDDVWTSGATMKECVRVLKKNKVKEVWGFTLARA